MNDLFPPEEDGEAPPRAAVASAVDEKGRRRRENARQRKEREDREFFAQTVQSEIGRRFLWSILAEAHAFETRFGVSPAGLPQPEASWMQLGEQQLGLRLYHTWHHRDPQHVMLMLQENDKRFQQVEV